MSRSTERPAVTTLPTTDLDDATALRHQPADHLAAAGHIRAAVRRNYVMAKLTYISAVQAAELRAVTIGDIHWELGQWGRFVVQGKGPRRSGPRERRAHLFQEGRDLLWCYLEGKRGTRAGQSSPDTKGGAEQAALYPQKLQLT